MKKLIALLIGSAFVAGLSGSALAQTPPAPKPEEKKMEKPAAAAEKPAEKKPAAQNASGTVKASAADSLTVTGKAKGKETDWTFSVDPKTKIRKNGKDITAADLAAGDNVHVRYHADGAKNVADSVSVRAAKKPAEAMKTEPKKEEKK